MKIKKHLMISVVLIILAVAATGCGSSDKETPEPAPAPAAGNEVIMQNHAFSPAEITIKRGETVTWTNKDSARHDVAGEAFKSPLIGKDESFEQTFDEAGTFEYSCIPHPYMKGKVIVTE